MDEDEEFGEPVLYPFAKERQGDRVLEKFWVDIPSDVFDEDDPEYDARMANLAIDQVRAQAPDYRMPANWWVEKWVGDVALVVRESRATPEELAWQ